MKKFLRWAIIASLWLLIWYGAYRLVAKDILIASPGDTFARLGELALTGAFWASVFSSMLRILAGFLLGLAGCCVLASAAASSDWCYDFFKPMLAIIKATPVASFIILALVWLPTDRVPVFTAFLIVLPVIWGNIFEGIHKTDPLLLQMAQGFRFSPWTKLRQIMLPSVMPYFMAGARTGMGMAWKAGIAAEVICLPRVAIGAELYDSKIYLDTTGLFAWTAAVIVLSILLERAFVLLVRKSGALPQEKSV